MADETVNRASGNLLPGDLLDPEARETLLETTAPAFLIGRDDGRVLWASQAAARRLGADSAEELMRIGLPALSPGTQRLTSLAAGIAAEAPRRLERLRFNIGFRSQIVTAMCQPLALRAGALALMVSLVDATVSSNDAYLAPAEAIPARRHDDAPAAEAVHPPSMPAPAAPAAPALPAAPAWVSRPSAERRPLRFVFALDADGIVDHVTPPLAEAVGHENAGILGRPLAAIVQEFDPAAAEAIRSATLAGETWSGVTLRWPVAHTDLAIPVDLSALPLIDGEEGLRGFSGFGRCHPERAETIPAMPLSTAAIPPTPGQQALDLPVPDGPEPVAGAEQAEPPAAPSAPIDLAPIDLAPIDLAPAENADLLSALEAFGEDAAPEAPATPAPAPVAAPASPNVVALRGGQTEFPPPPGRNGLSMAERNAFREIARALGAKFDEDAPAEPARPEPPPAAAPVRPALPPRAEAPASSASETPAGASRILDQLPVGILVLRGDTPLFANRTLLDLTDYPDHATFVAENGAEAIFRKSAMPRDRDSGFDTVVLTTREGELVPVDAHLQSTEWGGGAATLVSMRRAVELEQGKALRSVALDLKRVRTEAQELRAVLDTATDGVATLDEKGRILSVNGAAEALFGLNQNEVAGASFTTLLQNESHADALDYFEGLRANGVRSVLNDGREVYGREKKGGRIPLFMTLGRISDDEPKRYCAVLRDLTAWKRAENELTEARRNAELASAKKSDFLTKISHEIRTPMNAIIGFAEVMMEERLGPIDNVKYKEYLGDIRTSGKHVVSLVNDLLDLAKIEAGRMEMTFASTDLNAIVASSVGIIQPQANQNRVLVRTQLAQKLPPVVADERSIRQIILNMLSNATRFTESGGQVIVATTLLETGEAVIRIRDTGVGMTAAEIEHALEPFRQVGTRRDHGGTGLGLPLTKALVEANRANFVIRSTPGEGTMIEITFPSTRVLAE